MDLKALQNTVDSLDHLVLKLEGMGFDSSIFDDLPEAVESIKMAGQDAKEFRKSTLIVTFGVSAIAFAIATHFVVGYAIDSKIAKIERNQDALELLEKTGENIRINPVIDPKTGISALAVSSDNRLVTSQDAKTVFIVLKPQ